MLVLCRKIFGVALVVSLMLVCLAAASAARLVVPLQYPKIQTAINAATNGDTVVVMPGIYHECIDFKGKAITVRSTYPTAPNVVARTVINGGGGGSVVTFQSGEPPTAVLEGFTITGGSGTLCTGFDGAHRYGGGIMCMSGSPVITLNRIVANTAYGGWGGGIADQAPMSSDWKCGSPTVSYNTIMGNTSEEGGGIEALDSIVEYNAVVGNTASCQGGGGWLMCHAKAYCNVFLGNGAQHGVGGVLLCGQYAPSSSTSLMFTNNIVAFSTQGGGVMCHAAPGGTLLRYCDVYGNTGGNYLGGTTPGTGCISVDPLFANAAGGDYHLKSCGGRWNGSSWVYDRVTSPCIDAGDPTVAYNLEPAPNGWRINMGVYGDTAHASKSSMIAAVTISFAGTGAVAESYRVRLAFKLPVARASAQTHVSLRSASGAAVACHTLWKGDALYLAPKARLAANSTYAVALARGIAVRTGGVIRWGEKLTFHTRAGGAIILPLKAAARPIVPWAPLPWAPKPRVTAPQPLPQPRLHIRLVPRSR